MPIRLATVPLPADLEWVDEFAWTPVSQTITPTLTGALVIEEHALQAGRPITLVGGMEAAWVARTTLLALTALLTPTRVMTLTLADNRLFTVMWRHGDKPLEAQPIVRLTPVAAEDWYSLTLRLVEV